MTAYAWVELKMHDLDKMSALREKVPVPVGAHAGNQRVGRDEIEIGEKRRWTISAQSCA